MRRGIPLLSVISILTMVTLAGGVAIDRSVQRLPITSLTGGQDNTPASRVSESGHDDTKHRNNGNVLSSIEHVLGLTAGVETSSQVTSSTPGQGASGVTDPRYRDMRVFGTNISGLEFSGLFQPNTEQTYNYFKQQGLNTIRLPFDWNELQPDLYGAFDATSKQYVDQNITWAKQHGLSVILDAHDYGRRYIYRDGGLRDDFTGGTQHTFQLPYGDQDSTAGTLTFRDFGRGVAGTANDPVAPNVGYRERFEVKIDSFTGEPWNELSIDTFYQNDDNRYSLVINPVTNRWEMRQTINGSTAVLASGVKIWTVGQYYSFDIDINQSTPGKINVSLDGVHLFTPGSVASSPALTHGKISMFPSGVKATIRHLTLDIGGDTTSGGPIEQRVTESGLTLDAWKDFWTKLGRAYKDNPTVIGYDQNEPHDMPVPTAPNNYSSEIAAKNGVPIATASAMGQAMVDAIRATGDDKFVVVEMDHWANTHYFSTQYGADPTPWIHDSLPVSKIVYSGHYYFDSDHSGLYASGGMPPTDVRVTDDVAPFFNWCQNHALICYEGEFGVPNTAEWQAPLAHFLDLTRQYNIWWTQWAGGDIYSSATTLQPTSSYTLDKLQMQTIRGFLSTQ